MNSPLMNLSRSQSLLLLLLAGIAVLELNLIGYFRLLWVSATTSYGFESL